MKITYCRRDNVVSAVPRNRGSFPDRGRNFTPLQNVGIGPGGHLEIYLKDAKDSFRGGKAPGREADNSI
jgi:hypothetical protein